VLSDHRSREARALLAKSLLWLGGDLAAEERMTNEQIIQVFEDAESSLRILSRDEDYTEEEHREFELLRRKALVNLAAMHQRAKDLPRAEKIIRELIGLEPKNPERWYTLGLLLGFSGREEEAIAAYEKALELNDDPDWVDPCRPLGHLRSVGGDVKAADALLQRFVSKRPDSWDGWLTLGEHLFRDGRFKEAANAYVRCVELGPDGRDAVRNLYRALRRDGRGAEAEKWGVLFRLLDAEFDAK
jgi:Flp pilus assembly protein TadD